MALGLLYVEADVHNDQYQPENYHIVYADVGVFSNLYFFLDNKTCDYSGEVTTPTYLDEKTERRTVFISKTSQCAMENKTHLESLTTYRLKVVAEESLNAENLIQALIQTEALPL